MSHYLLAIDQGTTNSRAVLFDPDGRVLSQHAMSLTQFFPQNGWVEQSPEEMFRNTVTCCQEALKKMRASASDVAAIGLSNQRETTLIWDRQTGEPVYPAIVWQDRRTSELCQQWVASADRVREKTGLVMDPYFSASKIRWILDVVPGVRARAEQGDLAFGTVDTFLIWKLTGGASHVTDATNASRTLLFNIVTQQWDDELLALFDIPKSLLPTVLDCSAAFGETDRIYFGKPVPIRGVAGDQQAALVGQACFHVGMVKATYGTGGFLMLNTGREMTHSRHGLLSTIAYRLQGAVTYGLEGSLFCAGTTIKWLRDTVRMIRTAAETESLAASVPDTGGVWLVPAFTGLGAPYWDAEARGALLGLTRDSGVAHIARAALEAVAFQSRDLLEAMRQDFAARYTTLRVDGGMAENSWLLQFLADILQIEVQRPACIETSALGAAYLAGLQSGIYQSIDEIDEKWRINATFSPRLSAAARAQHYAGWKRAVGRVLNIKSPIPV